MPIQTKKWWVTNGRSEWVKDKQVHTGVSLLKNYHPTGFSGSSQKYISRWLACIGFVKKNWRVADPVGYGCFAGVGSGSGSWQLDRDLDPVFSLRSDPAHWLLYQKRKKLKMDFIRLILNRIRVVFRVGSRFGLFYGWIWTRIRIRVFFSSDPGQLHPDPQLFKKRKASQRLDIFHFSGPQCPIY